MSQSDPKRLLEDPSTSDELRLGLRELHRRAPAPEQVTRIVAGLTATGVAVKASAAEGSTVSATAAKTAPFAWKLALLAIVPAGVGLALVLPTEDAPTRPAPSLPELSITESNVAPPSDESAGKGSSASAAMSTAASEANPLPSSNDPDQGAAPDTPALPIVEERRRTNENVRIAVEAPVGVPHSKVTSRNSPSPPAMHSTEGKKNDIAAPVIDVPARSEVELLQTANTVVGGDPAEALQLCEEHRRAYPSGAMSQEREMIAITALVRLGRQEEAYARAEQFRRNYPKSAYLRQIDKVSPSR